MTATSGREEKLEKYLGSTPKEELERIWNVKAKVDSHIGTLRDVNPKQIPREPQGKVAPTDPRNKEFSVQKSATLGKVKILCRILKIKWEQEENFGGRGGEGRGEGVTSSEEWESYILRIARDWLKR